MPKLIAIACVLVAATIPAFGLDPNRALTQALHRIWQIQQGLPQPTIYRIRQTSDGYLWLGTLTGLVRFDGVHFEAIDEVGGLSLKGQWIHDLVEDRTGNLWVATDGTGLIRVNGATAMQFTSRDGLPSDTVQGLFCDSHNVLWICTPSGLVRRDGDKLTVFHTTDGLASDDLRTACEARDGALWFGGAGAQLSVFNQGTFKALPINSLGAHGSVSSLLAGDDGSIWVGTSEGVVRLKRGTERHITTADRLADNSVLCVSAGKDDCVWVGTKDGFSRIRPSGDIESFRSRDGLSQSTVYTLCKDREGSLWVGTKHGLNQFVDRRTLPFTTSEGLPTNDTGPVATVGGDGAALWVGTLGGGISRFDGRRFLPALGVQNGLPSSTIQSLAAGRDSELWVGTDKGLAHLKGGQVAHTYTTADGLPADSILCVATDSAGRVWAGTSQGLATLEGSERFSTSFGSAPLPRGAIVALLARRDGSVVCSVSGQGVVRIAGGGGHVEPLLGRNAGDPDAAAFFEDPDGTLWIATRGNGLLAVRDGAPLRTYSTRAGLYDDDIFGIAADDADRLWFACSKGIFVMTRASLRDFDAGKVKTIPNRPFSPMDALRTIECKSGVQPSVARMADGRLWFSTIRGVIAIDPVVLLRQSMPTPPVVVEEVTVNGRSQRPAEVNDVPPGLKNIEFRYTALSFQSPTRTTFRYKLEGFDKDWIDAGLRREAFYTNLPPAHFKFRVLATTIDGTSAEAANPVAFTVEPHLYQRRWFFPACALALAAAGWLAYRGRIHRLRASVQAILAERSRIARELHDTLMQGFSGVTMEMQALAARLPARSDERATLDEIIRDAGASLREARRSVAGLRTAAGPQSKLAESVTQVATQLTEAREIRVKLKVQPDVSGLAAETEYNLVRIAQEAIANAVRHSGCRAIELTLSADDHDVTLAVRDDGCGITRGGNGDATVATAATAAGQAAPRGHYGIIGMKERAAQIDGRLTIDSKPGRGTAVTLTVPRSAAAAPPRPPHSPAPESQPQQQVSYGSSSPTRAAPVAHHE